MRDTVNVLAIILIFFTALSQGTAYAGRSSDGSFDLVINNGRVIDPASGLDAVRSVGIKNGKITAISSSVLEGKNVIDASGEIVGPGFIDYHAHGGSLLSGRLEAFDGVTTSI